MSKKLGQVTWWRNDGREVLRWEILCDCGEKVLCAEFTNVCDGCGADYNMSGQLLAPRSQWGEETGESLADILAVDGGFGDHSDHNDHNDYAEYGDGGLI